MTKEQRETRSTSLNFYRVFSKRLQAIKPFSEKDGKDVAFDIADIGVTQVKRKAMALIFQNQLLEYEIWIEDPSSIEDKNHPHAEIECNLRDFLSQFGAEEITCSISPAYIYQDDKDKVYLMPDPTPYIQNISKRLRSEVDCDELTEATRNEWINLATKYHLEKIIGTFTYETKREDLSSRETRTEVIIDRDVIGKIRENTYLLSFAQKYGLTNFQFMRFRLLVLGAHKANIPIDYDKIAREILNEDN